MYPANAIKQHAAKKYAEVGKAVFPCWPGGKEPLTKHSFKDATTNQSKITAWWTRWPDANIGIPTGVTSGFFTLDVDGPEGQESLDKLEEEYGALPETATVETGRGGKHLYFLCPEDGTHIPCSAGRLGPGLDVRGEGGYVLAPPSVTEGQYKRIGKEKPVAAPTWLIELVKRHEVVANETRSPGGCDHTHLDSSEPIPEGRRNVTLTSICGRLHDGIRSLGDLEADLLVINERRCSPPLPKEEVRRIAASIHSRTPCPAGPATDEKTLAVVDEIEDAVWRTEWRGMGGKSERDVMVSLVKQARRHGRPHPDGVETSMGIRTLALAAALSKKSAMNAVGRLRESGWLRRADTGSGTRAGTLVLRRAKVTHSSTKGVSKEEKSNSNASGLPLRAPFSAPRLRWSGPRFDRVGDEVVRTTISRLGKTAGSVIDYLERVGGSATVEEIAAALRVSRPRDLRRRVISRLETALVVECSPNTVSLTSEWFEALSQEREATGEVAAQRRDMARYAREREAYRNRGKNKPDRSPSDTDLEAHRAAWQSRRGASGEISELQSVPDLLPMEALYALMDRPVRTSSGRGRLWQAFGDRVGVVLDEAPERVTFMSPADISGAA